MNRSVAAVVAGASLAAALVCVEAPASAKGKGRQRPVIVKVLTPLGLQGRVGAGTNIGIPFTVSDRSGKPTDVQMEFGRDRNADGTISEDEFLTATEDRLDVRDTRANKAPQLFPTSAGDGAANLIVWRSSDDVGVERILATEFLLSLQGRRIPDPERPGEFLLAEGPGGTPLLGGVQIRMRTAVRRAGHGRKARFTFGPWLTTERFMLDNTAKPSMEIVSVTAGAPVLVAWRAFSADTEDFDGDGILEVFDGEDLNGNGRLDGDRMGVAFDWHRLAPGENPAAMSDTQLAALAWSPCTRLFGAGDPDSLDARPGVPVPTTGDLAGVPSAAPGRTPSPLTFAWDAVRDAGSAPGSFILRGTPFCQHRNVGSTVYSRTVTNLGN